MRESSDANSLQEQTEAETLISFTEIPGAFKQIDAGNNSEPISAFSATECDIFPTNVNLGENLVREFGHRYMKSNDKHKMWTREVESNTGCSDTTAQSDENTNRYTRDRLCV